MAAAGDRRVPEHVASVDHEHARAHLGMARAGVGVRVALLGLGVGVAVRTWVWLGLGVGFGLGVGVGVRVARLARRAHRDRAPSRSTARSVWVVLVRGWVWGRG